MISRTAETIATARKHSPAIISLFADSITYARSFWWKRRRCTAEGAMKQIVEHAALTSVT